MGSYADRMQLYRWRGRVYFAYLECQTAVVVFVESFEYVLSISRRVCSIQKCPPSRVKKGKTPELLASSVKKGINLSDSSA